MSEIEIGGLGSEQRDRDFLDRYNDRATVEGSDHLCSCRGIGVVREDSLGGGLHPYRRTVPTYELADVLRCEGNPTLPLVAILAANSETNGHGLPPEVRGAHLRRGLHNPLQRSHHYPLSHPKARESLQFIL